MLKSDHMSLKKMLKNIKCQTKNKKDGKYKSDGKYLQNVKQKLYFCDYIFRFPTQMTRSLILPVTGHGGVS